MRIVFLFNSLVVMWFCYLFLYLYASHRDKYLNTTGRAPDCVIDCLGYTRESSVELGKSHTYDDVTELTEL